MYYDVTIFYFVIVITQYVVLLTYNKALVPAKKQNNGIYTYLYVSKSKNKSK